LANLPTGDSASLIIDALRAPPNIESLTIATGQTFSTRHCFAHYSRQIRARWINLILASRSDCRNASKCTFLWLKLAMPNPVAEARPFD